MKHDGRSVFADVRDEYGFLQPRDVIHVAGADDGQHKTYIAVTHSYKIKLADLFEQQPHFRWDIEKQAGREVNLDEVVNMLEIKQVYDFQLEGK